MVIDAAKGVEDRTRKLMEVTRLRDTPILTFMNKLDRDIRDPMELLDEVENELKIGCRPSRLNTPGSVLTVRPSTLYSPQNLSASNTGCFSRRPK